MPYLSWSEGVALRRHKLVGDCLVGRDPELCGLAQPAVATVSRVHGRLVRQGASWWIQDQGSANGTLVNGLPVPDPMGSRLMDGDILALGDWELTYSDHFPGLDGQDFAEGVGTPYQEAQPDPAQVHVLLHALELIHASQETLLQEGRVESLLQRLLDESLRALKADRGFVVMVDADGRWRCAAVSGPAVAGMDLSGSVLAYVASHATGVLSNRPLEDPRFLGGSVAVLRPGPLMCVPMALDGEVMGMLYLDRREGQAPFRRLDLALFQTLVRTGTLAVRHTHLAQRAMEQAELQGLLAQARAQQGQLGQRLRGLMLELQFAGRWLRLWGEEGRGDVPWAAVEPAVNLSSRLLGLAERGFQELEPDAPQETAAASSLGIIQERVLRRCRDLMALRKGCLQADPAPEAGIWCPPNLAVQAISGVLEPLMLAQEPGGRLHVSWQEHTGVWELQIRPEPPVQPIEPDAWTVRAFQASGLAWTLTAEALSVRFPMLQEGPPATTLPCLGLVTRDPGLRGMLDGLAAAGSISIQVLDAVPPPGPLPGLACLVLDASGLPDPLEVLRTYRRHEDVAAAPILVAGIQEDELATYLAEGATDWLPPGSRHEGLHHRIKVAQSLGELKLKALASERLDALRQMAGTLKHEINNPLAVISMQVELLERKYAEEPKLRKIADMVERIRGLVMVLQKMREAQFEAYPGGEAIVKAAGTPAGGPSGNGPSLIL